MVIESVGAFIFHEELPENKAEEPNDAENRDEPYCDLEHASHGRTAHLSSSLDSAGSPLTFPASHEANYCTDAYADQDDGDYSAQDFLPLSRGPGSLAPA